MAQVVPDFSRVPRVRLHAAKDALERVPFVVASAKFDEDALEGLELIGEQSAHLFECAQFLFNAFLRPLAFRDHGNDLTPNFFDHRSHLLANSVSQWSDGCQDLCFDRLFRFDSRLVQSRDHLIHHVLADCFGSLLSAGHGA